MKAAGRWESGWAAWRKTLRISLGDSSGLSHGGLHHGHFAVAGA